MSFHGPAGGSRVVARVVQWLTLWPLCVSAQTLSDSAAQTVPTRELQYQRVPVRLRKFCMLTNSVGALFFLVGRSSAMVMAWLLAVQRMALHDRQGG